MKKILAFILTMVMLSALCACGGGTGSEGGNKADAPNAFSVGYAKADISPTESVPMGGYSDSDTRWSQNTELPPGTDLCCYDGYGRGDGAVFRG